MKKRNEYCVSAFFDGFNWHRGGLRFQQYGNGSYKILPDPGAKNLSTIALSEFINMHAHLSHSPRYDNDRGIKVLDRKPNNGESLSFEDRILISSIESASKGVNFVCSSIRPEDVDNFIKIYNDIPIHIIPFLSIKNYHCPKIILSCLEKLNGFFNNSKIPIKAGFLLHSLYNVNEKNMILYCNYAVKNNIVIALHFFEWEGELDFFRRANKSNNPDVYYKMKSTWNVERLCAFLPKLINSCAYKILIHCNYIPHELIKILDNRTTLKVLCPTSSIRLGNRLQLDFDPSSTVFSTDGYFTNMGYSLITEIRTFNLISQLNRAENVPERLLSGITGVPKNFVVSSGLVKQPIFINKLENINFYSKLCGSYSEGNEGFDLINYFDGFQKVNIYEQIS